MDSTSDVNVSAAPGTQEHRFEFTGSGSEYFRIWIVNLLLTVITVGIYSPWAKVRRLRYFHGNTLLAGSSFEYHGEPRKILKGRLIAAAILAPSYLAGANTVLALASTLLFLVALPFIIVRSRRFQMRMTSWRNIRFDFTGTYGRAAKIYLGLGILIALTLGILFPYTQFAKQRFIIGETRFGQSKFEFSAQPGRYYAAYTAAFGWFLVSLIVWIGLLVLVGFAIALTTGALQTLLSDPREILNVPSAVVAVVIAVVVVYAGLVAVFMVPAAVATSRITNEAFSHSVLDSHQLQSNLVAKELVGLYLINLIGIVFTLGLYAPWAKVRLLRYQLANTSLIVHGNLDEFVATETANIGATGEEIGDFLDVDFGL